LATNNFSNSPGGGKEQELRFLFCLCDAWLAYGFMRQDKEVEQQTTKLN
jgi:hypothetical protein